MAKETQYIVVHPVRHNTRYHERGRAISLTEKEAKRLLAFGTIRKPDVLVEAGPDPVALSATTLAKLTVAELNAYAQGRGYSLPAGLTKEQILVALEAPPAVPLERQREVGSEIEQDAQRAVDMAEAQTAAEREGR